MAEVDDIVENVNHFRCIDLATEEAENFINNIELVDIVSDLFKLKSSLEQMFEKSAR